MPRKIIRLSVALFVAYTPFASLSAQQTDSDDILVQGVSPESLRTLLNETISFEKNDQLARFSEKICPQVVGVPGPLKKRLEARIRDNVEKIGLKTARAKCTGNLIALVSDEPVAVIEHLKEETPQIFNALYSSGFKKLRLSDGPSWAWHNIYTTDAYGFPIGMRASGGAASRIKVKTQKAFRFSFVVFEVHALDGVFPDQLADFITMRSLANIRDEATAENPSRTILTLFADSANGRPPLRSLSESDMAMLRALYTSHAAVDGQRQFDQMIFSMKNDLTGAKTAK